MLRIKQFLTLAGLTALEAIRQPICLLLAASCILLMGFSPILIMHNFGENGKMVRDSALALHFVFGVFVTGYAACTAFAREIRSGTASTVLCKPVSRDMFFLSKLGGVAAVTVAFSLACSLATLLSEKAAEKFYFTDSLAGYLADTTTGMLLLLAPCVAFTAAAFLNYRFRRPFESSAFLLLIVCIALVFLAAFFLDETGAVASFALRMDFRLVRASLLITIALVVFSSIALTLSTRLSTVPTLTAVIFVFLLGLMSEYLAGSAENFPRLAAVIFSFIPDWQHFWVCDALNAGGTIPWTYVIRSAIYAGLYLAGVFFIGIFSFRNAELK